MENSQKNKSYKALCCVFLALAILCIGLISAFEFDNVKDYDAEKREVSVTNAFGLGNEIAKIKQGEIIEILRQGEGMKTQYQVKVIIGKKEPNKIKNKPDAITDEDLDDLDKNINKK